MGRLFWIGLLARLAHSSATKEAHCQQDSRADDATALLQVFQKLGRSVRGQSAGVPRSAWINSTHWKQGAKGANGSFLTNTKSFSANVAQDEYWQENNPTVTRVNEPASTAATRYIKNLQLAKPTKEPSVRSNASEVIHLESARNETAMTSITGSVPNGSMAMPVTNEAGFMVGQQIVIDAGHQREERNIVAGFANHVQSIALNSSLQFNHDVGAVVSGNASANASNGSSAVVIMPVMPATASNISCANTSNSSSTNVSCANTTASAVPMLSEWTGLEYAGLAPGESPLVVLH